MTTSIPIFRNEINVLEDFRGGVKVARDFAGYVSAALSYASHGTTMTRHLPLINASYTAGFRAHSFGARVETGYRFATPFVGITPYAALQVQNFLTPSYRETAASGSPEALALSYDQRSATATRFELGAMFDKLFALDRGHALAIRTRAAWAHDRSNNPAINATFQGLPGSNFSVDGAPPVSDLALLSAGFELRLPNQISLGARFDGEFSSRSQTYTGMGTLRRQW